MRAGAIPEPTSSEEIVSRPGTYHIAYFLSYAVTFSQIMAVTLDPKSLESLVTPEAWKGIAPALSRADDYAACEKRGEQVGTYYWGPGCWMYSGGDHAETTGYGRDTFVVTASKFKSDNAKFAQGPDDSRNRLELAAFFGNVTQETGDPGKSGLVYSAELGSSCSSLFGKGPLQLTGAINYQKATRGFGFEPAAGTACATDFLTIGGSPSSSVPCGGEDSCPPCSDGFVRSVNWSPCIDADQPEWCNAQLCVSPSGSAPPGGRCKKNDTSASGGGKDPGDMSTCKLPVKVPDCWQECADALPKPPPEGSGFNLCKEPWLAASNAEAAWASSLSYWMNRPIAGDAANHLGIPGTASANGLLQDPKLSVKVGTDTFLMGVAAIAQIGCPSCCVGPSSPQAMTVNRIHSFIRLAELFRYEFPEGGRDRAFCKSLNFCTAGNTPTLTDTCPPGCSFETPEGCTTGGGSGTTPPLGPADCSKCLIGSIGHDCINPTNNVCYPLLGGSCPGGTAPCKGD